jgi:hypothetical protein
MANKELSFTEKVGYISPLGENSLFNAESQIQKPKKLAIIYHSIKFDSWNYLISVNIIAENLNSKTLILTVIEKEVFMDESIASYTIIPKSTNFYYDIKINQVQLQKLSKTFLEGDFEVVAKIYGDGLEAETKEIKLQSKSIKSSNPTKVNEPNIQKEPNLKTEYDKSGKLVFFEAFGLKYDAVSIGNFYELSLTYQATKIDGVAIGNPESIEWNEKKITKKDLHPEIGSWLVEKDGVVYPSLSQPQSDFDLTGCQPADAKIKLAQGEIPVGFIHTHPASVEIKLQLTYQMTIGGGVLHGGFPSPPDFNYRRESPSRKDEIDVIVDGENIIIYNKVFFRSIKRVTK